MSSSGNEMKGELKMTAKLEKMLTLAKEYQDSSLYWFKQWQEAKNENDEAWIETCEDLFREKQHKADAIREAYMFVTGIEIHSWELEEITC